MDKSLAKAVNNDPSMQSVEYGPSEISPQQHVADHDVKMTQCNAKLIFMY